MSFTDKIATIVTGKNKDEREEQRQKMKEIRRAQDEAYVEAKRKESIKYAQERARIERENAVNRLKKKPNYDFMGGYSSGSKKGYSSPVGYGLTGVPARVDVVGGFGGLQSRSPQGGGRFDIMNGTYTAAPGPRKVRRVHRRPKGRIIKKIVYVRR